MYVDPKAVTERRMDADYYCPEFLENQERLQGSGQTLTELKRLWREGKYGTLPPSADYADEGVVLIRGGDFRDLGIIADENLVRVPALYWENSPKARAEAGEVLLLAKGATIDGPNSVALCPPRFNKALVNGSVFRIKCKQDVDAAYLVAYMATPAFLLQKRRAISNTGIFYNDLGSIESFLVPLPPRPVQEHIGAKVRLAERCRTRARELREGVQGILNRMYAGAPVELAPALDFWVDPEESDSPRLDSWHYQPVYRRLVKWCREHHFVPVSSIASLAQRRWSPANSKRSSFHYIEISDVDTASGQVTGKELATAEAPSRARRLVKAFDILVSTVRPERKGVGIVTPAMDGWVASTGFSVLKAKTPIAAYFLCAALRHDVSTLQIMRWNTGATYPAVDADVPLHVLIPNVEPEVIEQIGTSVQDAIQLDKRAADLVREAKADAEALIEGRLDVDGIVAGRVQPPAWEEVAPA